MHKKSFKASINELHNMLSLVKGFCEHKGADFNLINKILLATEEALVNIIHHGYQGNNKGVIEISCEESRERPGVKIYIKDEGIPFNPMEKAKKIKQAHHTPLEDSSIGGYGIYLYVEIMDIVEYQRGNGINTLCLVKYIQ